MPEATPLIALYPGCSLEGTACSFAASLNYVLGALGIECRELQDWNCCGATSAHATDVALAECLALRNLAFAESQGFAELLAPCAACYHRLVSADLKFRDDPALLSERNAQAQLDYRGGVTVRNVLDFLSNTVSPERIGSAVHRPLSGLRVACYYGCLNTRIPEGRRFDDVEYPLSMDRIARALGAETVEWSYKTECCGASLFVTLEASCKRLVSRILNDAAARGADCIAVACPLCHNNLDMKQEELKQSGHIPERVPIVFISQLMGLAFGADERQVQIERSFVPFSWTPQLTQ